MPALKAPTTLPLPVVARLEVDALGRLPADVHRAAVVDPVDQRLGVRRDFDCRMGERSPHDVLEGRTQPRRRILPRTELRARDGIPQVFRGHEGRSRRTGSLNRAIRRIAETAQDAVDLDDVVGRLDVQAGEEIARRRVVEADRPVDGLFGIEDPLLRYWYNPAIHGRPGPCRRRSKVLREWRRSQSLPGTACPRPNLPGALRQHIETLMVGGILRIDVDQNSIPARPRWRSARTRRSSAPGTTGPSRRGW